MSDDTLRQLVSCAAQLLAEAAGVLAELSALVGVEGASEDLQPALPKNPRRLLTTEEVARLLRVTPRSVRNYVRQGELQAIRYGKGRRFRQADIDAFLFRKRER